LPAQGVGTSEHLLSGCRPCWPAPEYATWDIVTLRRYPRVVKRFEHGWRWERGSGLGKNHLLRIVCGCATVAAVSYKTVCLADAFREGTMHRRIIVCCLIVLAQIAFFAPAGGALAAPPTGFDATDVTSPLENSSIFVSNINAKSTAVGFIYASDSSGAFVARAFLYGNGKVKFLGGDDTLGVANDINSRGRIVGHVDIETFGNSRPAIFTTKDHTELEGLGGLGMAFGINGKNQIIGTSSASTDGSSPFRAILWEEDEMTDLGGLEDDGAAQAYDINDDGLIVGGATTGDATDVFAAGSHAVIWEDGEITDLGALEEGDFSIALAVNAEGVVVGAAATESEESYAGPSMQAFVWQEGEMQMLTPPEGSTTCLASSINKDGWVLGTCNRANGWNTISGGGSLAVLWVDGEAIVLEDVVPLGEGWTIERGHAVNDKGEIVATAMDPNFVGHALILTPMDG
jgi:probable HAF family extracellular repeat protein